jgi:hypothetical protein
MKMLKNGLIPTAIMAAAISACGGGPDIDQVKKDFDNPSGSGKDKTGVIAASGKQDSTSSNGALGAAGGGIPGFGLTAVGATKLSKVNPLTIIRPHFPMGRAYSALRVNQFEDDEAFFGPGCVDNADELNEASAEIQAAILSGEDAEVSFSIEISDLSKCDSSLSGGMEISYELAREGGKMSIEAEASYDNVCDSESGACLDGAFVISGYANGSDSEMVMAWDLKATGPDDDGNEYTIETKGGIRMRSGAGGSSFEYLQYVKDSTGEEVSYVLKIGADAMGNATLEFRCRDGNLSCAVSTTTGAGACTGEIDGQTFSIEWTDADWDSVTESDDFKG